MSHCGAVGSAWAPPDELSASAKAAIKEWRDFISISNAKGRIGTTPFRPSSHGPVSVTTLDGEGDVAVADLACPGRLAATDLDDTGDIVGAGLFGDRRMA